MTTPTQATWWRDPLQLALTFHNLYEQFAPFYGYETRTETRKFDPESANGQLMQCVCATIIVAIDATDGDKP